VADEKPKPPKQKRTPKRNGPVPEPSDEEVLRYQEEQGGRIK
jgi:hypothetical protein